jgi:hypothetical protein
MVDLSYFEVVGWGKVIDSIINHVIEIFFLIISLLVFYKESSIY